MKIECRAPDQEMGSGCRIIRPLSRAFPLFYREMFCLLNTGIFLIKNCYNCKYETVYNIECHFGYIFIRIYRLYLK